MTYAQMSSSLAGPIGLLKQYAVSPSMTLTSFNEMTYRYISRCGRETAEDAAQLFGGRSITQQGMGKIVENVSLRIPMTRLLHVLTDYISIIVHLHSMQF